MLKFFQVHFSSSATAKAILHHAVDFIVGHHVLKIFRLHGFGIAVKYFHYLELMHCRLENSLHGFMTMKYHLDVFQVSIEKVVVG